MKTTLAQSRWFWPDYRRNALFRAILLFVVILMIVSIFENEDFAGVLLAIIFIVFSLVKIGNSFLEFSQFVYYKMTIVIHWQPSILFIVG